MQAIMIIFAITFNGVALDHVEFTTMDNCKAALTTVKGIYVSPPSIFATCVEK